MERVYRSAEPNEDQIRRMISNLVAVTGHGYLSQSYRHNDFSGETSSFYFMHWGDDHSIHYKTWRELQDKYFEIVRGK